MSVFIIINLNAGLNVYQIFHRFHHFHLHLLHHHHILCHHFLDVYFQGLLLEVEIDFCGHGSVCDHEPDHYEEDEREEFWEAGHPSMVILKEVVQAVASVVQLLLLCTKS